MLKRQIGKLETCVCEPAVRLPEEHTAQILKNNLTKTNEI